MISPKFQGYSCSFYFISLVLLSTCHVILAETNAKFGVWSFNEIDRVRWIRRSMVNLSELEPAGREIYLGQDQVNTTLYVARATHTVEVDGQYKVGLLPGKFAANDNRVYYSYDGKEYSAQDCELLQFPQGSVSWVPVQGVTNDSKYILGGMEPDLSPSRWLYICRFVHREEKLLVIGKMAQDKICRVPFGGGETTASNNFEVLVLNAYGDTIEAGGLGP